MSDRVKPKNLVVSRAMREDIATRSFAMTEGFGQEPAILGISTLQQHGVDPWKIQRAHLVLQPNC